jgi:hypothetical protein
MKYLTSQKFKNLLRFVILSALVGWIFYFVYCIYGAGTLGENLSI